MANASWKSGFGSGALSPRSRRGRSSDGRATASVAGDSAVPGNRSGRPTIGALLALPLLAAQYVPISAATPPPDIRGIVPPQPYYIPALNLFWVAVGIISLLCAAWVCWYFFLRPRASHPRAALHNAREIALARLQELEKQADTLDPRVFGVEAAKVLRTYIGAQFGLHAERQTSPEFLTSIVHASVFAAAEKALLAEFLEQADLLKFARQDASAEARRSLLAQAGQFLQSTPAPAMREVQGAAVVAH